MKFFEKCFLLLPVSLGLRNMLYDTLVSVAFCVATACAVPMPKLEERQSPAGVPDYVLRYGECSFRFYIYFALKGSFDRRGYSLIKEHALMILTSAPSLLNLLIQPKPKP